LLPGGGDALRLIDPLPAPHFDEGGYPVCTGGPVADLNSTLGSPQILGDGELVGFTAGHSNFDFGATCLAGVGILGPAGDCGLGFGGDAPLFEGQISTAFTALELSGTFSPWTELSLTTSTTTTRTAWSVRRTRSVPVNTRALR